MHSALFRQLPFFLYAFNFEGHYMAFISTSAICAVQAPRRGALFLLHFFEAQKNEVAEGIGKKVELSPIFSTRFPVFSQACVTSVINLHPITSGHFDKLSCRTFLLAGSGAVNSPLSACRNNPFQITGYLENRSGIVCHKLRLC